MSCIPVPRVSAPTLPSPLQIPILSLPAISDVDATLCCHVHIPIPIPPINLGLLVTVPLVATINTFLGQMANYVNNELAAFENAAQCPFE